MLYKWGAHDSQKWGVLEAKWDVIVPEIKTIVAQTWEINGVKMPFPASFKEVR